MAFLLLSFNKYTASGVFSFSIHHFYVSKYNEWEWTQVYIRTFEKKQTKMRAGKKTIEEKQTILLGSMQRLR